MRPSPGVLILLLIVWAGCGRLDLDAPFDIGGGGAGGAGAAGGTGTGGKGGSLGTAGTAAAGTAGRGGVSGTAGSSATGTAGRGGVSGTAGTTGTGTAGRGGVSGTAGSSATGTAGRGGVSGTAGTTGTGTAGRGGVSGTAGTTGTGTAGRGGVSGTAGSGATGTAGRGGVSGTAGTTGTGGTGATGGGAMSCVPGQSAACTCATGAQGAQVCRADGTFDRCVCVSSEFQRIRDGMVGTWMGKETNPWTPPFQVRMTFGSDGHYSGHCAQASCPAPVLYYGSDDDSPLKTYQLIDLHENGTGVGRIALFFGPNNVLPGTLEAVYLTLDGQHLTFEFWHGDYGPLVFDLTRVP